MDIRATRSTPTPLRTGVRRAGRWGDQPDGCRDGRRRLLRALDWSWTRGEAILDRLARSGGSVAQMGTRSLNPLYHLGSISVFLLVVVFVTGVYVTVFYRPGADRAYGSVAGISATTIGSLIRSIHRYASQALLVSVVLHALKMLLGDRFWGSRWLSWVSGWVLVALIWAAGVMGYWLVWDRRAQWITEYGAGLLGGAVAIAFATTEAATRNSSFFVIVLFLHVFVPVVLLLGLWFHVMRLPRVRLWLPRWLALAISVVLVVVALWKPVTSAPPVDLGSIVGRMELDWWYLAYLPLVSRWGSVAFWGTATLVAVAIVALPWLARGRSLGPAVVIPENCTGCALCAEQCPYGAIDMRPRTDDTRFTLLAVVNPSLCTGCGLCAGVCSTDGIDLAGLAAERVRSELARALAVTLAAASAGEPAPVAIFTCRRHVELGTLPHRIDGVPLVTCTVPCVGMVHGEWVRQSLNQGARAAVVLGGPADDCAYREGPRWVVHRLAGRRRLLEQGAHLLDVTPGDREALSTVLAQLAAGKAANGHRPEFRLGRARRRLAKLLASARPLAIAAAMLVPIAAVAIGIAPFAGRATTASPLDGGKLRLVLTHRGKIIAAGSGLSRGEQARLPAGVSAAQVLGGERQPVRLLITIDGHAPIEREYRPGGLRREGKVNGFGEWPLPAGRHTVEIEMMDDGATWRRVFSGEIGFDKGAVHTLVFDPDDDAFSLR